MKKNSTDSRALLIAVYRRMHTHTHTSSRGLIDRRSRRVWESSWRRRRYTRIIVSVSFRRDECNVIHTYNIILYLLYLYDFSLFALAQLLQTMNNHSRLTAARHVGYKTKNFSLFFIRPDE